MAGYSGTPLIKKLGIKEGFRIRIIDAPPHYLELLGPLPVKVKILKSGKQLDFIHLFAKDVKSVERRLVSMMNSIKRDGMIWISWYKKSAKIPTDLNEDKIRAAALALGMVDVKVCAVDEQWSGLKIVIRKENR